MRPLKMYGGVRDINELTIRPNENDEETIHYPERIGNTVVYHEATDPITLDTIDPAYIVLLDTTPFDIRSLVELIHDNRRHFRQSTHPMTRRVLSREEEDDIRNLYYNRIRAGIIPPMNSPLRVFPRTEGTSELMRMEDIRPDLSRYSPDLFPEHRIGDRGIPGAAAGQPINRLPAFPFIRLNNGRIIDVIPEGSDIFVNIGGITRRIRTYTPINPDEQARSIVRINHNNEQIMIPADLLLGYTPPTHIRYIMDYEYEPIPEIDGIRVIHNDNVVRRRSRSRSSSRSRSPSPRTRRRRRN
jgi:hypothetical protein